MSFKWDDNGYQPKRSDVEATPPKGGSAMQEEIVKPMDPNAVEDFVKAIKKATNNYMSFDSVGFESVDDSDESCEPFCGRIRLSYSPIGAWNDMVNILVANGYDVYMEIEQPTETARELDGADKFVVIEYEEVE